MNKTIYKYEIAVADEFEIVMPPVVQFLHFERQGVTSGGRERLAVWVMVDKDGPTAFCRFKIRGTGHDCNDLDGFEYVGTVLCSNGLVWHLFAENPKNGEEN